LACTLMGIELFGAAHAPYLAVACFVAYLFSGHSGIYGSQRVAIPKVLEHDVPSEITLTELRRRREDAAKRK
jgi:H+/Cl- antiporter ClcA